MTIAPSTDSASGVPTPLAELVGITKSFGAVKANDGIDLAVLPGQVHALLGENGAGKSTLTRILYGLSQPDAGEIRVGGRARRIGSPADALAAGIGMVTQEFSLVGPLTVTENVVLSEVGFGRVGRRAARARVIAAADRLGLAIDPDAVVDDLSVGERQRLEIVKALYNDARVLVLDEPTAVLVPQDVELLFAAIRRLTAAGIGVIFISHKLHEVVEIADWVSILRRGRVVTSRPLGDLDPTSIAGLMIGVDAPSIERSEADPVDAIALATAVGLEVENESPPPAPSPRQRAEQPALTISQLGLMVGDRPRLSDISLEVAPGEIVGIAGVSGNGQTELVRLLGATLTPSTGTIAVAGRDVTDLGPAGRIDAGLGRITEDRKGSVVGRMSVEQNLAIEDLDRFRRGMFLDRRAMRAHAIRLIERFDIRATATTPIRSLSGGNMQKVLLARAIDRDPRALVVSQPTRGLDIGACEYVYSQLLALREKGAGILLISEDLDELLRLSDRVLVLFDGRIVGERRAADATPEALGLLMTGQVSG